MSEVEEDKKFRELVKSEWAAPLRIKSVEELVEIVPPPQRLAASKEEDKD